MEALFTIFGSSGFIGSHLSGHLKRRGYKCHHPSHDDSEIFAKNLGHVIYCTGLTSDARDRPLAAAEAHVSLLAPLLEKARFDSFLYLSSARIYLGAKTGEEDLDRYSVNPRSRDDAFNLSKLLGEALCFSTNRPTVRVVRPSNVIGDNLNSSDFFYSLIREARSGKILLRSSLDSEKDYVAVEDLVRMIPLISLQGRNRVYNLAYGSNISHRTVVDLIQKAIPCELEVRSGAERTVFPPISIERLRREFGFTPSDPVFGMEAVLLQVKNQTSVRA